MLNPIYIEATTLPDAWYQSLYKCVEVGQEFIIDKGSYEGQKRLEFDYIAVRIKYPYTNPLLPEISPQYNIPNPVAPDYLDEYLPYLMTGEVKEGEAYTYGQRLNDFLVSYTLEQKEDKNIFITDPHIILDKFINQVELLIWTYKNQGYRNNQMCLQIASPDDMLLKDPPCLRHIDTRVQDNKLHFFPYFRSWDLWGGFPANLAAIELMKQYIASEIGVGNGEIIASSKGLHLYNYIWELAEIVRGKTINEFKMKGI
jgi:thymidylate synthase